MKLQQLRYFQEVAMRNSVTKAANALYVSQPTISNAIRDLEEEYGLKLFTRSAGKLTLTKEGGYLLLSAQELLQHVGQIEATLRDFGSKETVIRLGITPMIGPMAIDMVRDFLAEYPDYKIELSDSPSMRSRQMLNREMLDFARRYGLYVTAGSDYHGKNKMIALGDTGLEDAAEGPEGLRRFLDQVRKEQPC